MMARIRTLKPEHRSHRKVGRLPDSAYRLWVSMILEADDEGRLVCDTAQLRAVTWPYSPKMSVHYVKTLLGCLIETKLIRCYEVDGLPYAEFPSWRDHQYIQHPMRSKLPSYQASGNAHEGLMNDSGTIRWEGKGKEGIGKEGNHTTPAADGGREAGASHHGQSPNGAGPSNMPSWGHPEALVELYNRLAPPGLTRVTRVSRGRRDKAKRYLAQFPEQKFWTRCFSELRFSTFLQGLRKQPGHESFRGDFDWLLTKGRDGTENCVKVAEGKYRDVEGEA